MRSTKRRSRQDVRKLLADVDFYKVGHHGSLNATPRKLLWEAFTKRKGRKLLHHDVDDDGQARQARRARPRCRAGRLPTRSDAEQAEGHADTEVG